jgi:hypothetical protein
MNAQRILALVLAASVNALAAATLYAQDAMPPMPDTSYGQDGGTLQSPEDLSNPLPEVGPAPHSVTIPIPGGGQVSVEGPDEPADENIPTNPGGQWGEQVQQPNSPEVGPIGP